MKGDTADLSGRKPGAVQFLAATHTVLAAADIGYPSFTDNDSFPTLREAGSAAGDDVSLIRAMLFTTTGSLFYVQDSDGTIHSAPESWVKDVATPSSTDGTFKLVLSCSEGSAFGTADGVTGYKIFTASLDPANTNYIGKILNTDPKNFQSEKHLLYLDFPIEADIAPVKTSSSGHSIALVSGSTNVSALDSGFETADDRKFTDLFGRFDTRYKNAKTTKFISQPFGTSEIGRAHV